MTKTKKHNPSPRLVRPLLLLLLVCRLPARGSRRRSHPRTPFSGRRWPGGNKRQRVGCFACGTCCRGIRNPRTCCTPWSSRGDCPGSSEASSLRAAPLSREGKRTTLARSSHACRRRRRRRGESWRKRDGNGDASSKGCLLLLLLALRGAMPTW
jgi:hypothetical protein